MVIARLLMACASDLNADADDAEDMLDGRVDPGEPPEDGFQVKSPEFVLEPYTSSTNCYFGTYDGPDVGVPHYEWYQDGDFGHHLVTLGLHEAVDIADGEMVDCSDPRIDQMQMAPLFAGTELVEAASGRMDLPDGTAIKLHAGQRFAMQMHHVNSTGQQALIQDAINVWTEPTSAVGDWAAPYMVNTSTFELPIGRYALHVRCQVPSDRELLTIMGHMHGYGQKIRIERERSGESLTLYEIDDWDESLMYSPEVDWLGAEPVELRALDVMHLTCEYENSTDAPLTFPDEMCGGAGLAWPLEDPELCDQAVVATPW